MTLPGCDARCSPGMHACAAEHLALLENTPTIAHIDPSPYAAIFIPGVCHARARSKFYFKMLSCHLHTASCFSVNMRLFLSPYT